MKKQVHNKKTGTRNLQTGSRNPKQEPLLKTVICIRFSNMNIW